LQPTSHEHDSAYPVGSIRVVSSRRGVRRPSYPLSILEFQERFATEEACRQYFFSSRWPEGFVCRACGDGRGGGETRRHLWVCTACGYQASVTAGTVMHGTRTPLRTWFWAAYLVAHPSPRDPRQQLQRQLGLARYETAWLILHKLRRAMVAPEREQLKHEIEIDQFFLGGYEEGLKGGRKRGKKALVGVVIEVRGRGSGQLRLQLLPDSSAPSLLAFAQATTTRRDRPHRRLAALPRAGQARLRPPPPPEGHLGAWRATPRTRAGAPAFVAEREPPFTRAREYLGRVPVFGRRHRSSVQSAGMRE
jgi:hypothetical protein